LIDSPSSSPPSPPSLFREMAKAKRSAASARAGFSSLSRSKFFTRHDNVAFYVPNLIGELERKRRREEEKTKERDIFIVVVVDDAFLRSKKTSFPTSFLNTTTRSPTSPSLPPGYTRVACAAYAFSVALTRPVQFMAFYFFR